MMSERNLKIYLFYCSNCIDTEALRRQCGDPGNGDVLKMVSLPCSGKIELIYMLKSFETGADGALLLTCRKGACQYLEGNLRAHKRVEAVNTFLEETRLGSGRMKVVQQMEEGAVAQIADEINSFCSEIKSR